MIYLIIKQDKDGRTVVAAFRSEPQAQAVMEVLVANVGDKVLFTIEGHKIV